MLHILIPRQNKRSVESLRVWLCEEHLREVVLGGALAEVADLRLNALPLKFGMHGVPINILRIGRWLEQVVGEAGTLSSLQVAKDQVNPLVQVGGGVVALKGLPVLQDEILRTLGPRGQTHITYPLLLMINA